MATKSASKTKRTPARPVNKYQATLCDAFSHGDYAYLAQSKHWRRDLEGLGDTLFKFLMTELSTGEGCEDEEEAVRRLQAVSSDVLNVVGAIEALPAVPEDKYVYANPCAVPIDRHKAVFLAALKALSVKAVEVRYHGKFDIAELHSIKAYDLNGLIVSLQTSTVALAPGRPAMLLGDALSEFTWDLLRVHVPAFMKFEGGNGKLRFDTAAGVVSLRHTDYREPPRVKRIRVDI